MDLCLRNYGYCNYLSDKHCCVFYDEVSANLNIFDYYELGPIEKVQYCKG